MPIIEPESPAAGDGLPADPLYVRLVSAHLVTGFVLSFAAMALLFGRPFLAAVAWALNLPVSAYACVLQARRLGRPVWLGLLCAPLSPVATRLLAWSARSAPRGSRAPETAAGPDPSPPRRAA